MSYLPVADSMDIAFLLVSKPSIHPWFLPITNLISTVIKPFSEQNYDFRLALIKTVSDDHSRRTVVHSLTRSVANFEHHLTLNHPLMDLQTDIGPFLVDETLRKALNLDWRSMTGDGCHENVVFLITNDLPCRSSLDSEATATRDDHGQCACDDLWTTSNEFNNRNLTLIIIGVGEIASVYDSLYSRMAQNTGGEYIPFINAERIMQTLMNSIIEEGYTMPQSLRHIDKAEFEVNSSYYYSIPQEEEEEEVEKKHCPMMARKGAWLLTHLHRVS